MKSPLFLRSTLALALLAMAACSTARAAIILDNLAPPNFNTAVGGDRVGAAIHIGNTPVTISTIEFPSFFTGGYVYRPGQTFAVYSRNADGTLGVPLFSDFTMTPGNNQNPRTTVTANSSYVLQANTGYWLVLSTAPGGNFVLWNYTSSTSYASDFGVTIPAARASFYTDEKGTFYFSLADGPQSARILGSAATPPAPVPTSVVSRKEHGAAGPFDIDLPLTGPAGVECRQGGDYQIVAAFPSAVSVQSASVTSGSGSVSFAQVTGNVVTVNLTGVSDGQRISITLAGVNDGSGSGDVVVRMGVLVGDTTGNGSVTASDISQAKGESGQAANGTNFRNDVDANGTINATDLSLTKSRSGASLPPARGGVIEKHSGTETR